MKARNERDKQASRLKCAAISKANRERTAHAKVIAKRRKAGAAPAGKPRAPRKPGANLGPFGWRPMTGQGPRKGIRMSRTSQDTPDGAWRTLPSGTGLADRDQVWRGGCRSGSWQIAIMMDDHLVMCYSAQCPTWSRRNC